VLVVSTGCSSSAGSGVASRLRRRDLRGGIWKVKVAAVESECQSQASVCVVLWWPGIR
jgi:hypothetical protein